MRNLENCKTNLIKRKCINRVFYLIINDDIYHKRELDLGFAVTLHGGILLRFCCWDKKEPS